MRPATVTSLVRAIAQQDGAAEPESALVGCWVSPGWSQHLTIDGHEDWPDVTTTEGGSGVATVVIARRSSTWCR